MHFVLAIADPAVESFDAVCQSQKTNYCASCRKPCDSQNCCSWLASFNCAGLTYAFCSSAST